MGVQSVVHGDLAPGQLLAGRFRIERMLGAGGMGTVYRALDRDLGEPVAIKILAKDLVEDANAAERLRREVRLSRRITHPNVVRVYDIGESDGCPFFTMELVDGPTLRQVLQTDGRLTLSRSAVLASAICEGLSAAHGIGIVHRDLKPSNIMLHHGGRAIVADFGIARSTMEPSRTTQGPIGTPRYMAPEQLCGHSIDARTDIYALGLVLHEMLTGRVPSMGQTICLRDEHLNASPAALAAAEELITRCLAICADDRPESASDLARLLGELPASAALSAPPASARRMRASTFSTADAPTAVKLTTAPDRVTTAPESRPSSSGRSSATELGAIAVLPLRIVGSAELAYLGETIAEGLVDLLSQNRGIRVLGTGVTARFSAERDPVAIGRALSAFGVVDGSVHIAAGRVRAGVRLLDAQTGAQVWNERVDIALSDPFAVQEAIVARTAEGVRFELTTLWHSQEAPPEAIEHYLIGRKELRELAQDHIFRAYKHLSRAHELYPAFAPAMSARAIAAVRAWFFSGDATWERAADESVELALAQASELPETHLAAAMASTQRGEYHAAVRSVSRALSLAPSYVEAREYLGMLQCEGGRAREGLDHIERARELNPSSYSYLIARHHALHGDFARCDAELDSIERLLGRPTPATIHLRIRTAGWRRARAMPSAVEESWAFIDGRGRPIDDLFRQALAGSLGEADLVNRGFPVEGPGVSPRLSTFFLQLMAELWLLLCRDDRAVECVRRAAKLALIDIEWLDHCPLLEPIRGNAVFVAARREVCARIQAMWT